MKLKPASAATILRPFIEEDRAEARIYRTRVQSVSSAIAVASFAISAFLIVHVASAQLRYVTPLVDILLIAVLLAFYWRVWVDLTHLRKAMQLREALLNKIDEDKVETGNFNPFPDTRNITVVREILGQQVNLDADFPAIKDNDLHWIVGVSAIAIIIKMLVLATCAQIFYTKGPS